MDTTHQWLSLLAAIFGSGALLWFRVGSLSAKVDSLVKKAGDHEARLADHETRLVNHEGRLGRQEGRASAHDTAHGRPGPN